MPHVDKNALESLIWEADLRHYWPDLDPGSDDAAADVLDKMDSMRLSGRGQVLHCTITGLPLAAEVEALPVPAE